MAKLPQPEIEHLFAAGWSALQTNRLDEAEAAFLNVLLVAPGHFDAMEGLATVYFHRGRLDDAWAMYEKALKTVLKFYRGRIPNHVDWRSPHDRSLIRSLHGLALTVYRCGDLREAERRFTSLMRLNPADDTGARFMLADIRRGKRWGSKKS